MREAPAAVSVSFWPASVPRRSASATDVNESPVAAASRITGVIVSATDALAPDWNTNSTVSKP